MATRAPFLKTRYSGYQVGYVAMPASPGGRRTSAIRLAAKADGPDALDTAPQFAEFNLPRACGLLIHSRASSRAVEIAPKAG